jgi:hypothetical protein
MQRRTRSIVVDLDPSKSHHEEEDTDPDTSLDDVPTKVREQSRMHPPPSILPPIASKHDRYSHSSIETNPIVATTSIGTSIVSHHSHHSATIFHPTRTEYNNNNNNNSRNDDDDHDDEDDNLLMGSMEFEESQASFAVDDGVVLPGDQKNRSNNQSQPYTDELQMSRASAASGMSSNSSGGSSSNSSSSSSESSDYTNSVEKRRAQRKKRQLTIGDRESRVLHRTRSLLLMLIVGIAMIGSITISLITLQEQVQSFEHDFNLLSTTLLQHVQEQFQQQYQSLNTFRHEISTLVRHNDSIVAPTTTTTTTTTTDEFPIEWPYITLRSSYAILERYLSMTNAAILQLVPIVSTSQITQWETYSTQSQSWMYVPFFSA